MERKTFQLKFWREGKFIVVHCDDLGITTQGLSFQEALYNIEEAINLYIEEDVERNAITSPIFSIEFTIRSPVKKYSSYHPSPVSLEEIC